MATTTLHTNDCVRQRARFGSRSSKGDVCSCSVAIKQRLEYLRGELQAERISYEELAELQSLAEHIDPGDVELLEAAGVPEFPETCEDRDYKCCEQLTANEHKAKHGYTGDAYSTDNHAATITSPKCDCTHADWQHAREGDARLEVEDYAIGQCYVAGCECKEVNLQANDREQQEQDSYDYRNEQEAERFGNVPCVKCGRDDLPLHANRHCPECYSDDHAATARPWGVYHNYIHGAEDNKGQRKIIAAITKDAEVAVNESNAALIVQAVNSHQALVDALQRARAEIVDPNRGPSGPNPTLAEIDAALKLATD